MAICKPTVLNGSSNSLKVYGFDFSSLKVRGAVRLVLWVLVVQHGDRWKITISNRRYIFKWWISQPAMLVDPGAYHVYVFVYRYTSSNRWFFFKWLLLQCLIRLFWRETTYPTAWGNLTQPMGQPENHQV